VRGKGREADFEDEDEEKFGARNETHNTNKHREE